MKGALGSPNRFAALGARVECGVLRALDGAHDAAVTDATLRAAAEAVSGGEARGDYLQAEVSLAGNDLESFRPG